MADGPSDDLIAESIAHVLVDGFNMHYRRFHESSALAKQRFDQGRWQEVQQAVRDRIQFYDDRVRETTEKLHREFDADSLSDGVCNRHETGTIYDIHQTAAGGRARNIQCDIIII